MLSKLPLLKSIGQFNHVGTQRSFTPSTFIYAENGRGKTTLAAIMRSLSTDDAELIIERKRLGSKDQPHLVVEVGGVAHVFLNGSWNSSCPDIAVFDDAFVAQNVCSGIEIGSNHRRNLHELILGAQGVRLNEQLQTLVAKIEGHNSSLRTKAEAIPSDARSKFTVDKFCELKPDADIEQKIEVASRRLQAAKSADEIKRRPSFEAISLPDFNIGDINAVLKTSLPNLQSDAARRVGEHFQSLGDGGEEWVAEGISRIQESSEPIEDTTCPFCTQKLSGSAIIEHYQAYFSEAYQALKRSIRDTGTGVRDAHGGDVPTSFERVIRKTVENREFWKVFLDVPQVDVDTAAISRDWSAALEAILGQLRAKAAEPLEVLELSQKAIETVEAYRARIRQIAELSKALDSINGQIDIVKEQAAADELSALTDDLANLTARKKRFDPEVDEKCKAYLGEKAAKKVTEDKRKKAREDLDTYRKNVFPKYETKINDYLRRFNAGFRLGQVSSVNLRVGSSVDYALVINNEDVDINAEAGPSFRNTLSAGDRNALALAFFFASLDEDPNLANKIVVIDDPMTSLDEHRSLTTRQELKKLSARVKQMIVLSHSQSFLCGLWEAADENERSAMRIARAQIGSELLDWDVSQASITEHDRNYELVAGYIRLANPSRERDVAQALRPILEAFIRIAYPAEFHPGNMLGPFIGKCQARLGSSDEILSSDDTTELRALLDYGNKFHHNTNRGWETEQINDTELLDFAERTLLFASRR